MDVDHIGHIHILFFASMQKNSKNFVLEILGDCEWELVGSGIDGVYDRNFDF